jgi:hypothetical protein
MQAAAPSAAASAAASAPAAAPTDAPTEEIPVATAVSHGLLSLLTPLVGRCDGAIRETLESQAALSREIDRVAAELEGFLGASQLPSFAPHAQRLADIRRRVAAADRTMGQVAARLARVEQMADRLEAEEGGAPARHEP